MWPYVAELFNDDDLLRDLADRGIAVLPSTLRESFDRRIEPIIEQATLALPDVPGAWGRARRSEEHTSELQSRGHLGCRILLEKKKKLRSPYRLPRHSTAY